MMYFQIILFIRTVIQKNWFLYVGYFSCFCLWIGCKCMMWWMLCLKGEMIYYIQIFCVFTLHSSQKFCAKRIVTPYNSLSSLPFPHLTFNITSKCNQNENVWYLNVQGKGGRWEMLFVELLFFIRHTHL